jgi:PleD family two-component response regulator
MNSSKKIEIDMGPRLTRRIVRGQESFVVNWWEAGAEQKRSFADRAEATAWLEEKRAQRPVPANPAAPEPTDASLSALPDAATPNLPEPIATSAPIPTPIPLSTLPAKTVLLVISDEERRQKLREILETLGQRIVVELKENRAAHAAETIMADVVLLTLENPEMPGFQVCREIRKSARGPHCKVIIVCKQIEPRDQQWGFKQGVAAFLTDPLTTNHVAQTLASLN